MILGRMSSSGTVGWYLTDHLGTVRDIASPSGQIIDHIRYDSFGRILSESNPSAGDRFKFTAREFDAATGQYYYRARYYDAAIGRFTSEDPLGFAGGDFNVYRYVGNDPTRLIDPAGTRPQLPPLPPLQPSARGTLKTELAMLRIRETVLSGQIRAWGIYESAMNKVANLLLFLANKTYELWKRGTGKVPLQQEMHWLALYTDLVAKMNWAHKEAIRAHEEGERLRAELDEVHRRIWEIELQLRAMGGGR